MCDSVAAVKSGGTVTESRVGHRDEARRDSEGSATAHESQQDIHNDEFNPQSL